MLDILIQYSIFIAVAGVVAAALFISSVQTHNYAVLFEKVQKIRNNIDVISERLDKLESEFDTTKGVNNED